MVTSNQIRTQFLDYFKEKGHEVVASSPLVPGNDPPLLFTNAGMVQFKDVFTGAEQRPYSRAVTAPRCVRAFSLGVVFGIVAGCGFGGRCDGPGGRSLGWTERLRRL